MRPIGEMAVFIEVVQQGSISAAARRLGIAVSVVADRVTGLERRLGVQLLTRTTRSQALTEAGMSYFHEARKIVTAVMALETSLMEGNTSPRGTLKVTAPNPIGHQLIAPFVGDFVQQYPEIQVHLTLEDRFVDIVGEGFDVAVRGGPVVDSTLMGRRLFETRRVIVGSPKYLAVRGTPNSPAELKQHDCLLFTKDRHFQAEWRLGRGGEAHVAHIAGRLASTNSELPLAWALAGLGLAQKSWWEVSDYVRSGLLVTILDEFEPDPATFFAIHPVSHAMSRKVAVFIDALAAVFKNPEWIYLSTSPSSSAAK